MKSIRGIIHRLCGHGSRSTEIEGDIAVLTEGPSIKHPGTNHRMEIIDLRNSGRKR